MPARHELLPELDVTDRYLEKILLKTYERAPENFEALLGIEGVGPKTLRALALASEPIARAGDLVRRLARRPALSAGGEEPELAIDVLEPFLHRAAHGRRHAARVPVEPEHAAERLKPEWIREPAQHLARAVLAREIDHDLAREAHHAAEQPRRRLAAVQRERCVSGVAGHEQILPAHRYRT